MSEEGMSTWSSERATLGWLATAAAALVLGAYWLRAWGEPYLMGLTAAIAVLMVLARHLPGRKAAYLVIAALSWFAGEGWWSARDFRRVEREWAAFESARATRASRALANEVAQDFATLRRAAEAALATSTAGVNRFEALEATLPASGLGEVAAVVYDGSGPVSWMGPMRLETGGLRAGQGVLWSDFYVLGYAVVEQGSRRAVVTRVLSAMPPADRLARSLASVVAAREGIRRFDLSPTAANGFLPLASSASADLWARSSTFGPGSARLLVEERSRLRGGIAIAVALLGLLALAWRRPAPAWRRLATLAVGAVLIALVPLSSLSNRIAAFDPSFFYAPGGGGLTASVGALAMTGALAVLAVLALRRMRGGAPGPTTRWAALATVVVIASSGPFLLRALSRGITLPSRGVPTSLWLAWEVALFLVASAMLLAVVHAGRAARRDRMRGLPVVVAPAIAAIAAIAAPELWMAPGRWPAWYPVPWILAVAAVALSRRTRGVVLHAAFVAACGTVTLVWGAVSRQRVMLAERDVGGLASPDVEMQRLLERFADDLQRAPAPRSRVDLLRLYVASDLAASGNPMELATWSAGAERPDAELVVSDFERRPEGEREVVREVAATARSVVREFPSGQGMQLVLGTPLDSGRVVTVVVSPRTRLIADDPFAALLGLDVPGIVEPPYQLAVASLARDAALDASPRWERSGDELHTDWRIGGVRGYVRAHVEVELRSLDALVQRGALLVLVDLALVAVLWTLAAAADGALGRWSRVRVRRWRASYRTRLTAALFGAFVLPAAAFAIWTYRRLQDEDRLSRELLVRETLRAVAATSDLGRLSEEGDRLDTPLFLYNGGQLARSSDELYDALVPLGRFLDPVVAQGVALGDEVAANRRITVGGVTTLLGYRVLMDTRSARIIVAAPARRSEQTLERQQSDLAVLVAFATALGALAALWLSGVVARGLARPIGALRDAAIDVAGGERSLPSLGSLPPYEFRPVYTAFRGMVSDLEASRAALEQAQQRTEAVLRNVASGVVACDAGGTVSLANAQAERILGAPVAPGVTLAALGLPELHRRLSAFGRDGVAGDDGFSLEHRGRQLQIRLTRLTSGGGGVVLTVDDVTELARAQRVFAWGEMARQVAHEIKNPLTPIRLGVQHLRRARADRRDDFDAILERNVARILAEIDRLDEIARSFSKFGTVPGERPPGEGTDVRAVVRDVINLERLGDSQVEWIVEDEEGAIGANGAPDREVWAVSRADELREVLLNLLENARHANARRVVTRILDGGGRVTIEVADDGDGIASEVLPRVFEPQFSTRTSGSGLGLAISKRLVDSWGGSIQVAPALPKGTIVRVTLVPATAE